MNITKYIGIPFKPLGRNEKGCDCWGLARLVYKNELGIDLPSMQYAEKFDPKELTELIEEGATQWVSIPFGSELPGDVLILRSINPHVGVVIDKRNMLHIQATTNACIARFDSVAWNKRIIGIYRHADLA